MLVLQAPVNWYRIIQPGYCSWFKIICIIKQTTICSHNNLSLVCSQAIVWTSARLLVIVSRRTNWNKFDYKTSFIQENDPKMASAKMAVIFSTSMFYYYDWFNHQGPLLQGWINSSPNMDK